MSRKRGSVAVVGAAESDLGQVAPDTSPIDLMAQATLRALDDCGLKLSDIDGVFAPHSQVRMALLQLREYLRIKPRYFDGTIIGGSSFMSHVAHAQAAIEHGLCEVARDRLRQHAALGLARGGQLARVQPLRDALPPVPAVSAYAMAAARHMHQYGTTREQLAEVAVAARKWALMNPKAWEKEPLTIEQVLNARMVSYPFTVRDCCLVADGGGAIIITSAARAKSLKKKPAYVLGVGESHRPRHDLQHARPHRDRRGRVGAEGVQDGGAEALGRQHAVALRRVHDHADPVPRGPRLLPQGRRRPLRLERRHRARRQARRSTRAAADFPTATPACTACWS